MNKPAYVVSLITQDNDYQMEQAASAEEAARRLGVGLEIVYADNDSIQQSQQILKFVQTGPDSLPAGLFSNPWAVPRCRKWHGPLPLPGSVGLS
jgi:hypothetical protein